ncbi:MAG: response regulator [Woeseiaceae bacterium]
MQPRARVLFVDDEKRVLNSVRGMFRRDFDLFLAADGETAVDIASQERIDVIVADQRMPGMSGTDVLGKVKQLSPNTIRILLTGYADPAAVESSINIGEVFRFLGKPCPPKVLRETLNVAVKAARSTREAMEPEPPRLNIETANGHTPQVTSEQIEAADTPNLPTNVSPAQTDNRRYEVRRVTRVKNVGVTLYTVDSHFAETAIRAISTERHTALATSLVKVIQELKHDRTGVLVADVTDNDTRLQGIIATLKRYVPELVTIVVSDSHDSSNMIDLINCGQIYRYLLKPVTATRLRTDISAAAATHLALRDNRDLLQRHTVVQLPARHELPVAHTNSLSQMQKVRYKQASANGG